MDHFGLLLLELGMEERQVNIMRQVLHNQECFEPFTCFRYLSKNNQSGCIQHKDITAFFKKHKLLHNKFEAVCLIKALDQNNDGSIGYSDFLNFIKPNPGETKQKISTVSKHGHELDSDVEIALLRLFQRELELHRKLEGLKTKLIEEEKVCLQESFFYFLPECNTRNFFTIRNLQEFMTNQCQFELIDEEIQSIFRRLDRDRNGQVSCEDFANVILPLHFDKQEQINWMYRQIERNCPATSIIDSDSSYTESIEIPVRTKKKTKTKKSLKSSYKSTTSRASLKSKVSTSSRLSLASKFSTNQSMKSKSKTACPNKSVKPKKHSLKSKEKRKKFTRRMEACVDKCRDMFEKKRVDRLSKKKPSRYQSLTEDDFDKRIPVAELLKENKPYFGLEVQGPEEFKGSKSMSDNQIKLEHLKQELCHREDFNIFEVYKMYFDTQSKGAISQEDFNTALRKLGCTKKIELDAEIRYSEFCSILLPMSKSHADLAINRTPIYTNYSNQNNDLSLRSPLDTSSVSSISDLFTGNTHKTLQDSLSAVFSQYIICKMEEISQTHKFLVPSRTLSDLDTNYCF
ncbi:unnamed protein product [Moneuplotes crassus]|uniref:EF-hand domain-containing protein n=1 Tax=Euplotes crassus TaxID=5936 RepID=A0AAD1X863_EUPCR|nr:unnamed protein product [Moneuplotes crassus]